MTNDAEAEATAEFMLRLRALGIRDLSVLRALETVQRQIFAPHRYADLAGRDVALPIGCGQTMSEPSVIARMMEALSLASHQRVLEIGTGSGYATAILARLAGEVLSLERFQSLVLEATLRLEGLAIGNVSVVWDDGLAIQPSIGRFDRVLVHAAMDEVPEALLGALAEDGILVSAIYEGGKRAGDDGAPAARPQRLVRFSREGRGTVSAKTIWPTRLTRLIPGLSRGL